MENTERSPGRSVDLSRPATRAQDKKEGPPLREWALYQVKARREKKEKNRGKKETASSVLAPPNFSLGEHGSQASQPEAIKGAARGERRSKGVNFKF